LGSAGGSDGATSGDADEKKPRKPEGLRG